MGADSIVSLALAGGLALCSLLSTCASPKTARTGDGGAEIGGEQLRDGGKDTNQEIYDTPFEDISNNVNVYPIDQKTNSNNVGNNQQNEPVNAGQKKQSSGTNEQEIVDDAFEEI